MALAFICSRGYRWVNKTLSSAPGGVGKECSQSPTAIRDTTGKERGVCWGRGGGGWGAGGLIWAGGWVTQQNIKHPRLSFTSVEEHDLKAYK